MGVEMGTEMRLWSCWNNGGMREDERWLLAVLQGGWPEDGFWLGATEASGWGRAVQEMDPSWSSAPTCLSQLLATM